MTIPGWHTAHPLNFPPDPNAIGPATPLRPQSRPCDQFAALVLSSPDPEALMGAMQVAFRRLDDFVDAHPDLEPYGRRGLDRWYMDAVAAYHRLIEEA